jgi:hypothetical protein
VSAISSSSISGSYGGASRSATLTVNPPPPSGVGTALPARLPESTGQTFYVSPTGSDSNPGTLAAPWRTIQKAVNTLSPGQKAQIRAGTYDENVNIYGRSGTATAPITIEAYPGEKPIIGTGARRPIEVQSNSSYFRFRGLIFEKSPYESGGQIDVYGHHIEISNNEIRNGKGKGVYTDESSHHVHIIGNWIHHNATIGGGQQDHGIYLQGSDHFVANNVIHDHPDGFGIQVYDLNHRSIIVNNTITHSGHSGIVVGGSGGVDNITIRNNILAYNSRYGVQRDSTCPTSNVLVDHNVIYGNGSGTVQTGCSAINTSGGNITSNPLLVNVTNRDLSIQSTSPAIGATMINYSMPSDYLGRVRDSQPDIGAYEYSSGSTPPPPPPSVSLSSLTLNPVSVISGFSSQGTVTLSGVAPTGDAVVTLTNSNLTIAVVPTSVTVAAGATSATFTITTNPVSAVASATIAAIYNGNTQSASLTVNPQSSPPSGPPSGPPQSGGTTYYVSPLGNDTNPGTQASPFRSIQKAADIVNPGDTVVVENGVYTDTNGDDAVVKIGRGGLSNNWIVFRSKNRWGAKLDGQNSATSNGFEFINGVGYVRIEGFEIYGLGNFTGSSSGVDIYAGGHDVQIVGNHLHHIGNNCSTTTNGQVAVYIQRNNVTVEGNFIHDIGRHFPGESGCTYPSGFFGYQTLDHGIYLNGGGSDTSKRATGAMIRNNVFSNIKHGWGVQFYPGTLANINVLNNTFAFGNPNKNYSHIVLDANISNTNIANNIFYQPEGGKTMEYGGGTMSNVVVRNNLTSGNSMTDASTPSGMALTANLMSSDPSLVNPLGFDFHLQPESPAIDGGASLSEVVNDYEGRARPQGAGHDIGAIEFPISGLQEPAISAAAVSNAIRYPIRYAFAFAILPRRPAHEIISERYSYEESGPRRFLPSIASSGAKLALEPIISQSRERADLK